jgi:sortase A
MVKKIKRFFRLLWASIKYIFRYFFAKKRLWRNKFKIIGVVLVLILLVCFIPLFYKHNNKTDEKKSINSNQNQAESMAPAESKDLGNFYISIEKLNINAPIIQGVDPTDKAKYNESLRYGVAHMEGTALPGTGTGNIFIYGHSSSDADNKYSKIFTSLNDLVDGDIIKLDYKKVRYEYKVIGKKVVEKTDLSVLDQTKTEILTLMTCWPIDTDDKRLIVAAGKNE